MENRMTRATEARSLSVPADMEPTSTDNTFDSSIGYVLRDTYRGFSRVLQFQLLRVCGVDEDHQHPL